MIIVSLFFTLASNNFQMSFHLKVSWDIALFSKQQRNFSSPPPPPHPPFSLQLLLLSKYKTVIFFTVNTTFSVFECFGTIQQ